MRSFVFESPVQRINDWISPNTGDIALLANMQAGFHFDSPLRGNHGSLAAKDALVPVGFGYPSATEGDTTLDSVLGYLGPLPEPVQERAEAESILRFFLAP